MAEVKVADDATAYVQQLDPTDQMPKVEIVIVGTILEALHLAVPPPPQP